jgi:hypothetical protein
LREDVEINHYILNVLYQMLMNRQIHTCRFTLREMEQRIHLDEHSGKLHRIQKLDQSAGKVCAYSICSGQDSFDGNVRVSLKYF